MHARIISPLFFIPVHFPLRGEREREEMQHLRGGADAFSSQSRVVFYVNEDSLGACEVAVQVMLFSVRVCAGADRRL
jgi:hypothetical protein